MSFIKGKNVLIEYQDPDLFTWSPILCAKSCDIKISHGLLKVTDTINGVFAAYLSESLSGVMTTSGLVKYDLGDAVDPIDLILNRNKIKVRFTINDTDGTAVKYLESEGFIQELGLTASVFALAEQGITIQLSGIIEKGP